MSRDLRDNREPWWSLPSLGFRADGELVERGVLTWLGRHSPVITPWRERGMEEQLGWASFTNRMQLITECLVFLDSCGCDPTPRIHLRKSIRVGGVWPLTCQRSSENQQPRHNAGNPAATPAELVLHRLSRLRAPSNLGSFVVVIRSWIRYKISFLSRLGMDGNWFVRAVFRR